MVRALTSLLIFITGLPIADSAQNTSAKLASDLPSGWIQAPSRQQDAVLWQCAGFGGSWVASNDGGHIALQRFDAGAEKLREIPPQLRLSKKMIGRRSIQPTSSGWLMGFDAGEFGGGLWWFSHDGSRTIGLLSDNVHAIYQTPAGILILVGLNHMGLNYGNLYKFRDTPPKAAAISLAALDGSPEASTLNADGSIIVATTHSVLRVDTDGQVHTIYKTEEYLTYPTSVAVDTNGSLYVAMRFFVLRLIPQGDGYHPEWLMPEQCLSVSLDENICACNGKRIRPH